jgi:FecR protein
MLNSNWKVISGLLLVAILSAPAWGASPPMPGSINYVEGEASIGGRSLGPSSVGTTELETGQTLATNKGKAEVLLTPGIFFRLGDDSSATMVSPSLSETEVRVNKGRAMVEVTQIYKENDIRIEEGGATTRLLKTGLYGFDAEQNQVRVFNGKAVVQDDSKRVSVKGGREVNLNEGGAMQPRKFDERAYEAGDLYRWSSLRSAYLAEANVEMARLYPRSGWIRGGWYWDPWFDCYTFFPADGILYSPFGWGFNSPWWVYRAPIFYSRPYYRSFGRDIRRWGPAPRFGVGILGRDRDDRAFRSEPQIRVPDARRGFGGEVYRGGDFRAGGR